MSNIFLDAFTVSLYANSEALLIVLAGVYAVWHKVVAPPDLKSLSKLLIKVIFPCLSFSNFQIYSLELLLKWYTAAIVSALTLVLGYILGYIGGRLLGLKPPHTQILILSTAFGNVGALPYVLVPPIAANWQRVRRDPEAMIKGYGVIAIYAVVWSIALFGLGQPFARSMQPKDDVTQIATSASSAAPSAAPSAPRRHPLRRALALLLAVEPGVYAALVSIVLGCMAPVRQLLSPPNGPLLPVGAFTARLGRAGPPLSTLILGGTLYLGGAAQLQKRRQAKRALKDAAVAETAAAPDEGSPAQPPAEINVEIIDGGRSASSMTRLTIAAIVIKLVLIPAISIPLLLLAARNGLLSRDEPMLFMVLMLQSAVPSAQTGLALVVAAGLQAEAGQMSMVYLPMYVLSIFTLAAVIVASITLYDSINPISGNETIS